jgi:hypothetical protein
LSLGLYVCLISIGCPHISQALEPAVEVPGGEVAGVRWSNCPVETWTDGQTASQPRDDKENAADPNADEEQGLLLYKEIDRAYSL